MIGLERLGMGDTFKMVRCGSCYEIHTQHVAADSATLM